MTSNAKKKHIIYIDTKGKKHKNPITNIVNQRILMDRCENNFGTTWTNSHLWTTKYKINKF